MTAALVSEVTWDIDSIPIIQHLILFLAHRTVLAR
jgi:hypothetical protein